MFGERIAKLEVQVANLNEDMSRRFGDVDRRFDKIDEHFDKIDKRFDRLEAKLPDEWKIAKICGAIIAALAAAAIFGPRIVSLLK